MKRFASMLLVAVMLVSAALLGTGCSGSSDTIKVGFVGPLTEAVAEYGVAVRNGAKMYIDEVNKAGGINGKKIEFIEYDSKGDEVEAVNMFNRLVESDKITALIGEVTTAPTKAVRTAAYPLNMPMITASATDKTVTVNPDTGVVYSNVFRTCFIDPFQGTKMADYLADVVGVKTVATLYLNGSSYSEGLNEAFVAECKAKGVTVAKVEAYAEGDIDFNAQLTNIKAANVDAIFCPNYYSDNGMIVKQARALGINAILCGGDGWTTTVKYATKEELEGCLFISSYAKEMNEEWSNKYKDLFGIEASMFAAMAYDAAIVMVNALTVAEGKGLVAGSDEYKAAVVDAIRNNSASLKGITSDGYVFDAENNPIKSAVIIEIKDGQETYKATY